MIPGEILKKIRHIEIATGRLVAEVFAGQYESVFKGRGMEFSEVREYQPGDDVKLIDWNVTARFGHPFVKKFIEERELTVMLVVDKSASGRFGTSGKLKSEMAAEICAVLAFSAMKNNDRVGLLIFTDRVEKYIPPKKGRTHALHIIRDVLYREPEGRNTSIGGALKYLNDVVKKRSIVFLISDFFDTDYEKLLRITNKHHDTIVIEIYDSREYRLPDVGIVQLQDLESKRIVCINTKDPDLRKTFEYTSKQRIEERHRFFNLAGIDYITLETGISYVEPLIAFFRKRAKKFR